jgi:L-lactate dehydrogenase complex protein LldF
MLLALRTKLAEGDSAWGVKPSDRKEKLIMDCWSWMIRNRAIYDRILRLAALGQKFIPQQNGMLRRLPQPLSGWTQARDLKPLAKESFIQRWKKVKNAK